MAGSRRSPAVGNRRGIEDLGKPRSSRASRSFGERKMWKKTGFADFPIRRALAQDPEVSDHVSGHVVPLRHLGVEEEPVQDRRPFERDARFLLELACNGLDAGLSDLHPAAWKMPAGNVAVPHQQDFVVGADHNPANAKRQWPRDEEAPVQHPEPQPFSNRRGHIADTPDPIQDCLSVQAILFPSGQWLEASSPWRIAKKGARG